MREKILNMLEKNSRIDIKEISYLSPVLTAMVYGEWKVIFYG